MDNIFKHQFGDPKVASEILYGNLMNRGLPVNRLSPVAFTCDVPGQDGSQSCHMVISTPDNHVFSAMPDTMLQPPPAISPAPETTPIEEVSQVNTEIADPVPEADMLVTKPQCSAGTCPTCGGVMPSQEPEPQASPAVNDQNNPAIPDDQEIVAIVAPADIYNHIPDSELYESFETKMTKSIIPHNFSKERAIKEIGKVMVKKFGGNYIQHSFNESTHIQKDGRINKILTEDNQYIIKSYKG